MTHTHLDQTLRIEVQGRPPNLANARLHFGQRARLVAERKRLIWALAITARNEAGLTKATEPRQIMATVYLCGRIRDQDNLAAGLKADIDGLVEAGWLVDDSPDWCECLMRQVRCDRKVSERVEWRVEWDD